MKLFLTNLQSHWFSIDYGEGLDKGFFMSYICKREDTENTKPMDFKKIACTVVRRWNEKRMAGRAKDVPRSATPQAVTTVAMAKTVAAEAGTATPSPTSFPQHTANVLRTAEAKAVQSETPSPKSRQPRVRPRRLPRRTIRVPFQRAHRSHGVLLPV